MALVNYRETNLAKWQLVAGISAAQTTINLKAWEWDLFPSVFPFMVKIEKYDSSSTLENKPVTKREIIRVNNRVWDVLTVTRGYESCPADDTTTTPTNTAFAFDTDDYVFHVETAGTQRDIKDELVRLETDKLDISSYISWDRLFKDSSTGTDSYQVNISEITSYAQIDWQAIRVRVDVGNTADATLEINALWAKDIVKFYDDPLQTWDIKAWQIIFVVYNANTDDFEIVESMDQSESVIVKRLQEDVILWEDVVAWDWQWAVFFWPGIVETRDRHKLNWWTDISFWDGTQIDIRESISVPNWKYANIVTSKIFNVRKQGSPTDDISIKVYESDGTTLIVDLGTISGPALTTSYVETDVALSNIDLSSYEWQNIYIELSRTWWQNASNYYQIEWDTGTSIEYFNWASWVADNTDPYTREQRWFNYEEDKVRLSNPDYKATNIANGIIISSWLAWETKQLITSWKLTQSSVSVWSVYYLWKWTQDNTLDTNQYDLPWSWSTVWRTAVTYNVEDKYKLEHVNIDVSWSYLNAKYVAVYVDWVSLWSVSWTWSSWNSVVIDFSDVIIDNNSVIEIKMRWSVNNQALHCKNIEMVRKSIWYWEFSIDIDMLWFEPFVVWKWTTTTWITLMINEQNFHSLYWFKQSKWMSPGVVYLADSDGIVLAAWSINWATNVNVYADFIDWTTLVARMDDNWSWTERYTLSVPILKWQYYQYTGNNAVWGSFYPITTK